MDVQASAAMRTAAGRTTTTGQDEIDEEELDKEAQASQKRSAEQQMKRDMMATILDSEARERLARIALVSPGRASQIESILLRMVQSGQLRGRVTEQQLIGLLEQAEEAQSKSEGSKKGAIVFQRRRDFDDDFDF